MLHFYNTFTGKKEKFIPIRKGRVKMYTCGPTVYDYAHLGNFRAYIFEDILRRFLKYQGYEVTQVMNITDIDDKTIAGAGREGVGLAEFTKRYTTAFFEDLKSLNIEPAEFYPLATKHIEQMVELIKKLLDKGYAYRKDGSIYFRIRDFKNYGRLSKMNLDMVRPGSRIDHDEYGKGDVKDFVLWKARKTTDEPFWDTELGPGRPGWHIECSAMSIKYLGQPFDIHTGGEDNIFPHHENEIAQSEAALGKKFVNYWLHCKFLLVNNEKMAKSKGNFFTLRNLLDKGYKPGAIRWLLLSTHYRATLNFTFKGLKSAEETVQRLNDFLSRVKQCRPDARKKENRVLSRKIMNSGKKFEKALSDDLNISKGLAHIFELVRSVNIALEKDRFNRSNLVQVLSLFEKFDLILGIFEQKPVKLTAQIRGLIKKRQQARRQKDFILADRIRKELFVKGLILEDTKDGVRCRYQSGREIK
ncbi:MAG: cysteine--tRNA ligase [Candidatus Omnitrophota bacterium]|nr:cysteine--tRNA ligase [Candidatus Omnitrophota bacterium]